MLGSKGGGCATTVWLQLTLISFSGQTNEAENGGHEEEVVKEKEVVKEMPSEATVEVVVQGGEARDLPGSLKTPRRKAYKEHPPEVLSKLHLLQYR